LPYIGIEVPQEHEEALKAAAREAVREMLGTKESYYYIDFNAARFDRTRQTFLLQMKNGLPSSVAQCVERAVTSIITVSKDEQATAVLIADALYSLANHGGADYPFLPAADAAALETCTCSWNDAQAWYDKLAEESDTACWTSPTEWDRYLRSLTDLPSALSDYLWSVSGYVGRVPLNWSLLQRRLPQRDYETIKAWIRGAVQFRAPVERTLVFPAYAALDYKRST
jgi:hypothetical protein